MTTLKHRLAGGSVFRRESSGTREPYRVIFLSVEGKKTEVQYFNGLNKALARGDLPFGRCVIQVLERKDHHADPGNVVGLLEEYLDLRYERFERIVPSSLIEKYGEQTIRNYFRGFVGEKEREFEREAEDCGRPVSALKDLSRVETENDVFGDIEDIGELAEVFENRRISSKHTFVSRQLSLITHSYKRVDFAQYVDKLQDALRRARQLETDVYRLLDAPGTNLPLLFDIIAEKRESIWDEGVAKESAATVE